MMRENLEITMNYGALSHDRCRPRLTLLLTAAWFILETGAALAAYRIGPGDVLDVEAAAAPELKTKAMVNGDGEVSVPLVGQIAVGGLTLSEARARIQGLLPGREFRRRTEDGREFPVILSPSEINVSILEYRPVYLNGDVAKPGEQVFRPGLTVRQGVSLAGGFDILRFKMDNPFLQLAELRAEYNTDWIAYSREQQRLARLKAELDGKQQMSDSALIETPVAASLTKELSIGEAAFLKTRTSDTAKEKAYLVGATAKETARAKVLAEQEAREKEGVQADTDDFQRSQDLYNKGSVTLPRVIDARRSLLLSSTRALQTTALLASVEREQGELGRRLERVDDTRRLEVLREMQESNTRLASIRAKLQAVSEKLRYTGMVKSQLVRGQDSHPQIAIFRKTGTRTQRIDATYDTELQPGDIVEVALQAEEPADAATR
jgi:polysaccharide export outer membrane protein